MGLGGSLVVKIVMGYGHLKNNSLVSTVRVGITHIEHDGLKTAVATEDPEIVSGGFNGVHGL